MSMLEHALTWWNLGYAPLPIRPNGSKAPTCRWRDFLETRPTGAEVEILFTADHDGFGHQAGNARQAGRTGVRRREQLASE